MKKLLLLLSTLLIAVTETSFGNQPDMEKIPQNANWVAHVNIETFRSSEVGSFVLKEILKLPQMKQKLNGLKIGFGVDIDQLGFVTAYGSGAKNEGVIFAKGGFNTKQLEGFASLNEKVEIKTVKGQKIYSSPKVAFSPLGPDSMIAATKEELLKAGLNARLGNNKKQKNNPILDRLNELVKKPIATITAQIPKVRKMEKPLKSISPTEQAIMEKLDWAGFALGESGASIQIACVMNTEDIKTAEHMENILRGVSSLLSLSTEIEPLFQNDPKLNKIIPHIKTSVSRKSQIVGMQLEMDTAFLLEMIEQEMAKKRKVKENSSIQE
ncbi:MAG: hypothetical protein HN548_04700 [Opitutae bacterium]|nr:hypothetical protein [Opitutae bacterium]